MSPQSLTTPVIPFAPPPKREALAYSDGDDYIEVGITTEGSFYFYVSDRFDDCAVIIYKDKAKALESFAMSKLYEVAMELRAGFDRKSEIDQAPTFESLAAEIERKRWTRYPGEEQTWLSETVEDLGGYILQSIEWEEIASESQAA